MGDVGQGWVVVVQLQQLYWCHVPVWTSPKTSKWFSSPLSPILSDLQDLCYYKQVTVGGVK